MQRHGMPALPSKPSNHVIRHHCSGVLYATVQGYRCGDSPSRVHAW